MRFIVVTAVSALLLLFPRVAKSIDWPNDYVVHEHSTSPDGKLGILVPSSEDARDDSDAGNYVADVSAHQVIGKIEIDDADYFERQNHRGLDVIWAPDSKRCVLEYRGRFGYDSASLLKVNGAAFSVTDLGKQINKTLKTVTGEDAWTDMFFRFGPVDKLLIRAVCYTGNPKMIEANSKQARFAGTFDLKSKKWTKSEARKIKDWEGLAGLYSKPGAIFVAPGGDQSKVPADFAGGIVNSEEEKFQAVDEEMNQVYKALRGLLPPERFAKLRDEQKLWLKERDAAQSAEEKSKRTEERTKALRDLSWQ